TSLGPAKRCTEMRQHTRVQLVVWLFRGRGPAAFTHRAESSPRYRRDPGTIPATRRSEEIYRRDPASDDAAGPARCGTWWGAAAVVVAIGVLGCDRSPPATADSPCTVAFDAARWPEAAVACEQAARPDRPDLLVMAARAWQRAEQPDRAI